MDFLFYPGSVYNHIALLLFPLSIKVLLTLIDIRGRLSFLKEKKKRKKRRDVLLAQKQWWWKSSWLPFILLQTVSTTGLSLPAFGLHGFAINSSAMYLFSRLIQVFKDNCSQLVNTCKLLESCSNEDQLLVSCQQINPTMWYCLFHRCVCARTV